MPSRHFFLRPLALVVFVLLGVTSFGPGMSAQSPGGGEYRAYWVETFNTRLGTRAEIDAVVDAAVASNANAIFAQVRRRGDSWYLDSKEPLTQVTGVGEPDSSGAWTVDPLAYLIERSHARGIEVHAFVIVGAIYNAHPTITGLPRDPNHVFNTHFWDRSRNDVLPHTDPRQWSTRVLPHHAAGTTFNGQRFTAEWYVDLGHPDAAAYTVDVLTHLVARYDLDGLHLDRIRYPEAPIDMPTASLATWGINVGYNETSVNRFKTRHGANASYYTSSSIGENVHTAASPRLITAGDVGYPRTNDPLWNDWRREQVTNFVRRLYLSATAVKPRIKMSAALICFWTGPQGSGGWERTEAHYRVFQDWRSWAREGTLDILTPMIYKREHSTVEAPQYNDWLAFTKSLAEETGRFSVPGLGAYLNGVEGTLRQARRALARAPFEVGNSSADGIIFYALGDMAPVTTTNSTSAAVTNNPFAYPAPATTPKRSNADFFAGLTTGASVNGTTLFEAPAYGALFATPAAPPDMTWKTNPTRGHAMGFARTGGVALDGAAVSLYRGSSPVRTGQTDGGGFFGFVGLDPGSYRAIVQQGSTTLAVCSLEVAPGLVASADARADVLAPVASPSVSSSAPGQNGWHLAPVMLTLAATDDCAGVSRLEYSLDGASWLPYLTPIVIAAEGVTRVDYRAADLAGNSTAASFEVKVDLTDPTATLAASRTVLWPVTGNLLPVSLQGTAADSASGLSSVTYQVIDEYGLPYAIDARMLSGTRATWRDSVALEARRDGFDADGRHYRILATVTDVAGRTTVSTVVVTVPHDQAQ